MDCQGFVPGPCFVMKWLFSFLVSAPMDCKGFVPGPCFVMKCLFSFLVLQLSH